MTQTTTAVGGGGGRLAGWLAGWLAGGGGGGGGGGGSGGTDAAMLKCLHVVPGEPCSACCRCPSCCRACSAAAAPFSTCRGRLPARAERSPAPCRACDAGNDDSRTVSFHEERTTQIAVFKKAVSWKLPGSCCRCRRCCRRRCCPSPACRRGVARLRPAWLPPLPTCRCQHAAGVTHRHTPCLPPAFLPAFLPALLPAPGGHAAGGVLQQRRPE